MKKILIAALLSSSIAMADWTDTSISEPTIGCMAVGGANYLMAQSGTDSTQAFVTGCLVGGIAGYFLDSYYTNKVSNRYEEKLKTYKAQRDEIVIQQAINSSQGIEDYGVVIKKEVVPGKMLRDGTIQLPTIRLKMDSPGRDVVIGD